MAPRRTFAPERNAPASSSGPIAQLTLDDLLVDGVQRNLLRKQEREAAHLPGRFDEAVPFYRDLIEQHHAAMVEADFDAVMRLRAEAHLLAQKLNGYEPGILADDDAPGRRLDRATRAVAGLPPLWGQSGSFEITHGAMRVRIEMDGLFGIGACHMSWLGFAAHAVDPSKPFLSETGYRSFLGVGGQLEPGYTPESFTAAIVETYVRHTLKGRLCPVRPLGSAPPAKPSKRPSRSR